MSAAKHTPGPWLEGRVVATGLPVKFQKYGDDIWWPREQSDEEAQANLRLADAAPELLAAAQKAMAECCDLAETDAGRALEAAVAKATGGQP